MVIFGLRVSELNNKKLYLNFTNIKALKDLFLLFFLYLLFFLLLSYTIGHTDFILSYFSSQQPTFDILKFIKNLFNFYFAPGAGVIFSLLIPIILIAFGFNKDTMVKLFIVLIISFMLSFWKGFHGGVPGSRYLLPFLFIFIDEYVLAIKNLINKKNKLFIIMLFALSLLNIPTLEYRNLAITEYSSGTINTMKPAGPTTSWTELEEGKRVDYVYYDWPINKFKFNSIYFGNYIIINKLLNRNELSIGNINFNTDNVYPQTGFARLLYIKNKNIDIKQKLVTNILNNYYNYFFYLYVFVLISFIIYFSNNLKKIIKLSEKN